MSWPVNPWGGLVFFGVIALAYLVGVIASLRMGRPIAWIPFIGGSDGRLSLSRLQALIWTLVIFASFAAAMAVSTSVVVDNANSSKDAWIAIPAQLLQLAGIAIGSGVFSSLIASTGGEAATGATVSNVNIAGTTLTITGTNLSGDIRLVLNRKELPAVVAAGGLSVTATNIDSVKQPQRPRSWLKLVLDTPSGRLAYEVSPVWTNGTLSQLTLGTPTTAYEFADLFRDDQHPRILDLMKFQMFGWTVIAVVFYVTLFLSRLTSSITTLPNVDATLVILTGISQSGYLAGKGVGAVTS
jgi:hypothetical protein